MNRQIARMRHAATILAILLSLAGTALYLTRSGTLALPVRLHFSGLTPAEEGDIKVAFDDENRHPFPGRRHLETSYWYVEQRRAAADSHRLLGRGSGPSSAA